MGEQTEFGLQLMMVAALVRRREPDLLQFPIVGQRFQEINSVNSLQSRTGEFGGNNPKKNLPIDFICRCISSRRWLNGSETSLDHDITTLIWGRLIKPFKS